MIGPATAGADVRRGGPGFTPADVEALAELLCEHATGPRWADLPEPVRLAARERARYLLVRGLIHIKALRRLAAAPSVGGRP